MVEISVNSHCCSCRTAHTDLTALFQVNLG